MARVLVPLAQGCEELEAITVIDLLRRAGLEVVSAGLDQQPVTASRGNRLLPDSTLDRVMADSFDMIVLPGGQPGADNLRRDPRMRQLLQRTSGAGGYCAAICAAPKVLASAGLLDGRRATCYPGALTGTDAPGLRLVSDAVVRDGKVVTSRGPGTAIAFSLELIELLAGRDVRNSVASGLLL